MVSEVKELVYLVVRLHFFHSCTATRLHQATNYLIGLDNGANRLPFFFPFAPKSLPASVLFTPSMFSLTVSDDK